MLVVPSGTFGTQVHQETLKLPLEITKDLNKIKFNGFVIFYEVKHSPFYQIRNWHDLQQATTMPQTLFYEKKDKI